MARTVWCGATPGLLPLESALRKLPGIIAHLGFIPKSCQYVLLSRDGEKCAGEGFEPDRGVARCDPHEPIARGALRGNQSRAFAPPQGAPPPPTAAHDAAMSPPTTRGRYCLGHISASVQHWGKAWTSRLCHVRYAAAPLALPLPWGFNPPKTKKLEAGPKLQVPLPISWCRAGVSASIEVHQGQGWTTPSAATAGRQARTYVAVSGAVLVRSALEGQVLLFNGPGDRHCGHRLTSTGFL